MKVITCDLYVIIYINVMFFTQVYFLNKEVELDIKNRLCIRHLPESRDGHLLDLSRLIKSEFILDMLMPNMKQWYKILIIYFYYEADIYILNRIWRCLKLE